MGQTIKRSISSSYHTSRRNFNILGNNFCIYYNFSYFLFLYWKMSSKKKKELKEKKNFVNRLAPKIKKFCRMNFFSRACVCCDGGSRRMFVVQGNDVLC